MLLDRGVYTGCKIISSRYMLMTSSSFIYSFTTNKDTFTYYHVGVTSKYKYLFNHNFKVALDKAKIDMERWSSLRLSLAGKINSVTSTFIWKIKKNNPLDKKRVPSSPVSLRSLVCTPLPLSKHLYTNNPVVHGSIKIWAQFSVSTFQKLSHPCTTKI